VSKLDRHTFHVLVPSAQSLGGIGVIRSLGAAGYVVHAAASNDKALGLKSKFARHRVIHPQVTDPGFANWFSNYVDTHQIRMVVPGGGISPPNNSVFDRYSHLFPVNPAAEIQQRTNKFEQFQVLSRGEQIHRANLPPLLLVDTNANFPKKCELRALGTPLFLKFDGAHSIRGGDNIVKRFSSSDDAWVFLNKMRSHYHKAVVQGFVPGKGVGVFLLRWRNRIVARFMHKRLHEMPHTGGASSLRQSWWHDDIARDAQIKFEKIGWEGVGMVEYRWDEASDRFYLMEMNLRFWGSLHLALYAGVDFPLLLADAFFGVLPTAPIKGRCDVLCRNTIPGELGYLVSLWRDRDVPIWKKLNSLIEGAVLTLNPNVKSDLWYPGDRYLYLTALQQFLRTGR